MDGVVWYVYSLQSIQNTRDLVISISLDMEDFYAYASLRWFSMDISQINVIMTLQ